MCGIVGYVGGRPAQDVLVGGLERLEYRGYDSAGVAVTDGHGGLEVRRAAGHLGNLIDVLGSARPLAGHAGIGHTRWATHGPPTTRNAHPHRDAGGRIAVVHNGIIENAAALRTALEDDGSVLASDTDSEVVAHLLAREMDAAPSLEPAEPAEPAEAVRAVVRRLDGAFTLVFSFAERPDVLVAARRGSPLVLGVGAGEMFVASDTAAFSQHTDEAIAIGEDEVVTVTATGVDVTDFAGRPAPVRRFCVEPGIVGLDKGGHATWMRKEIDEQPGALLATLRGPHEDGRLLAADDLIGTERVVVVACGSAYHAGLLLEHAVEAWCRVPVEVEVASEFRYRNPVLTPATLVVAISQSGETADTLEAVRHARSCGARTLAICNTVGAQIPRECDAVLPTRAGPERGVAATKTFTAQVLAGHLLALSLARALNREDAATVARHHAALAAAAEAVRSAVTAVEATVARLATDLAAAKTVLYLGRGTGYAVALEGALKLKELAYAHAEGFPAGELKHGPLALVESGTPIIVVMPGPKDARLHTKVLSNVREVQARGARTVIVAAESDEAARVHADELLVVPDVAESLTPLVAAVPLQLLALHVADQLGFDIDKPRNIAKSVTVE